MASRHLLIVNTGKGKGKTTAALGAAVRAAGQGKRVCFIQFIKGRWPTGERKALERFSDLIEMHTLGSGFTWKSADLANDTAIARDAWSFARETLSRHDVFLVVLDELTYLIKYEMVSEEEVLGVLKARPAGMHVVVTGRDASPGLVSLADLVTEMQPVKHPFESGVSAQKGIEF